jgi:hypothetical protein
MFAKAAARHDDRPTVRGMNETWIVKTGMVRARKVSAARTPDAAMESTTASHVTSTHATSAALRPAGGRDENYQQRVEEVRAPHGPIIALFARPNCKES